ncbi:MAG: T9SS type A sorting domain-containing protein [Bacteroidia bacterium]|nr:T9SS type A sorting domain-containing protein [Bacteroidia bacterium]
MKKNLLSLFLILSGLSLVAQSPRLSLYEEFTGETCPPCAATNPGLNALLKSSTNASKIVAIKWQVPIPSVPSATWSLYKTNQAEIDWRYRSAASGGYGYPSQSTPTSAVSNGINSAPSGRIDGQHQWTFGSSSDHPASLTNGAIATAQSYTSAFSVTMTREWNHSCTAVNLTVNIVATAPFTAVGSLKFRTVMVEREIHFSTQPGTNGEKDFEDVAIKSFPTLQNGISMAGTWTLGQSQTFTMSCPIPSYVRSKEQIALVGFIQDDGNKKVAQAARADKAVLPLDAAAISNPVVDVTCDNLIHPLVTVSNEGQANAITDMTITPYVDGIAGNPTTWTGNLAAGANTQIQLNAVTTPTLNGSHTFSCDIQMNIPNYNLISNTSKMNYMVASVFTNSPVQEEFMYGIYPPTGWMALNTAGGGGWSRSTVAGNNSYESSKYDFYNSVAGTGGELYLPPLDLIGGDNIQMSFDVAYAQRQDGDNDVLDVLASYDCGASWEPMYSKSGAELATTTPYYYPAWVPTPNDVTLWRNEVITLTGMNKSNVLIKFVTTAAGGNNIYIDNVNVAQTDAVGLSNQKISADMMSIYPNPASNNLTVKTVVSDNSKATLKMVNTLGQVVYTKDLALSAGQNSIDLNVQNFATGIYNVVLISENGSSSVKKVNLVK